MTENEAQAFAIKHFIVNIQSCVSTNPGLKLDRIFKYRISTPLFLAIPR